MKALEKRTGLVFDITAIDHQRRVVTLGGCRYRYFDEVTFLLEHQLSVA